MEPDEIALSEVHVGRDPCSKPSENPSFIGDYRVEATRFEFDSPHDGSPVPVHVPPPQAAAAEVDEDGDLVLPRKRHRCEVITIEHTLGTRLPDVGLQVWQGSLLLADYVLANHELFCGCHALELGGGVGLTSIVMATCARHVICTDIGAHVLDTCQRNADANRKLYEFDDGTAEEQSVITVRELDWTQEKPNEGISGHDWRPQDLAALSSARLLLAADVIYDIDLTEAFFCTIHRILSQPPGRTLYISLEKRLNFTLSDLDVACPAYTHFRDCLHQLTDSNSTSGAKFKVDQVPIDFPQYFHYERTEYLELWKVMTSFEEG